MSLSTRLSKSASMIIILRNESKWICDCEYNSIDKSRRSIIKKANFTGEQFQNFYTQCMTSVTCSIHFTRIMSSNIMCVSIKLTYLGVYFIEKRTRRDLHDLQYGWDCNISVVFSTLRLNAAKIIDHIEKCCERKLRRIRFPAKNWVEADLYIPRSGAREWQTFAV